MSAALLDVRGLSKSFTVRDGWRWKKKHALVDVSFDVHRGEVVALVGESGSGKSTVARIVARLMEPSRGSVRLNGAELIGRHAGLNVRSKVQMVFQDPYASLNPIHRVGYHLERPMLRHGKAKDSASAIAKAASLLESVGLRPGAEIAAKYPHELSGGQRQRVAVARALAVDPALILADEPTSMLDASIRVGVLNLLRDLKERRGIAFLYITHDLASARYLADRTLVLYGGHLVEEGPADELFDRPAHPYTKMLLAAAPGAPGGRGRDASIVVPAAKPSSNGAIAHSGCVFSERCPDVKDQCRRESPAAKPISAARLVRCHFA